MTVRIGRLMALILSASSFIIVSCQGKDSLTATSEEGKGKVMLSLYSDIVVKSPRAVSETDDYNFRFVGVGSYGTSQYYKYGDVTWPMDWYFGVFRLQAESCTLEEAEAGYGKLRYEGIGQPFSIINDQIARASVLCTVANFRVAVNFNDKMFMSYKDFKLTVESVLVPVYEENEAGEQVLVSDQMLVRSLDFNTLNKVGYYNLGARQMNLRYTLYVMEDGADEFIEMASGYFSEDGDAAPAVIHAGDYITLNVNYMGEVKPTPGIKFVVEGARVPIMDGIEIDDYVGDSVTEDK